MTSVQYGEMIWLHQNLVKRLGEILNREHRHQYVEENHDVIVDARSTWAEYSIVRKNKKEEAILSG